MLEMKIVEVVNRLKQILDLPNMDLMDRQYNALVKAITILETHVLVPKGLAVIAAEACINEAASHAMYAKKVTPLDEISFTISVNSERLLRRAATILGGGTHGD